VNTKVDRQQRIYCHQTYLEKWLDFSLEAAKQGHEELSMVMRKELATGGITNLKLLYINYLR